MTDHSNISKEAIRAAKAAYAREYRRKNPEKVRASQERYWERKIAKELAHKEGMVNDAEGTGAETNRPDSR